MPITYDDTAKILTCEYDPEIDAKGGSLGNAWTIDDLCDVMDSAGHGDKWIKTGNQHTLYNIDIKNSENSEYTLYDVDDDIVDSSLFDGSTSIPVTYTRSFYAHIDTSVVSNYTKNFSPFKLKVTKSGYLDLIIEDININPGEKTELRGNMVAKPETILLMLPFN